MALPPVHFDPFNIPKPITSTSGGGVGTSGSSSGSDPGYPPCQICTGPLRQPSFIGRIRHVFSRPADSLPIEGQPGGRLPSPEANWAEWHKGDSRLLEAQRAAAGHQHDAHAGDGVGAGADATQDGQRACLIAQNGMLTYSRRGSSAEERFRHIWWVRQSAQPFLSSVASEKLFVPRQGGGENGEGGLGSEDIDKEGVEGEEAEDAEAHVDEVPDNVVFPLCGNCARIARNYVSHWNLNHPHSRMYGYDILFLAFKRRLESLRRHADFRKAFYIEQGPRKDLVICLGTAVVVLASPATAPFNQYTIPSWSHRYPYAHYPSLPRWLLSKLKRLPSPKWNEKIAPMPDSPSKRDQKATEQNIYSTEPHAVSDPALSRAREANESSGLLSLPIEILQFITSSLDRHSLFALRLTSIRLAWSIPLDQGFWFRELVLGGSGSASTSTSSNSRRVDTASDQDTPTPPLFGFEPLNADAHTYIQSGSGVFGRIDAFSEIIAQFKPLRGLMFDPVKSKYLAPTPGRRDWRKYDWSRFVRTIASADEFLDGGSCADAPEGFKARRWLWGQLDKAFACLRREDVERRLEVDVETDDPRMKAGRGKRRLKQRA